MNPIALMIDIETLGLGMRSVVTQIGYVVGNLETGEVLEAPTDLWMDVYAQKRDIDFDTVRWWMKQDRAVSDAVLVPPDGVSRITAGEARARLEALVTQYAEVDVWASPAMFDLSILTDLFGGVKPWVYNAERDMMTLRRWLDPDYALAPPENGMQHLASADAKYQFDYLCVLYRRMKTLTTKD